MPAPAGSAPRETRPSRFKARLRRSLRTFTSRPRLLVAAALGVVALFVLPTARLSTRLILAWDIASGLHLVLAWIMMATSRYADLQRRADKEDVGAVVVLVLTVGAAIASLVAIAFELHGIHDAGGAEQQGGRLALAAATILISWFFVHTMFALHYSHDYYAGEDDRGGLKFPQDRHPDYWDFLYFSFTMGAASQTSDVSITAPRMRRFVLAHTILSFLFNTTILALAINVGASLL